MSCCNARISFFEPPQILPHHSPFTYVEMGLWFNIGLAVFAATGSFLFGYDSGVMTIVIASPHFLKFFNTTKTTPTIGAINATFSGGAVFGSLM